MNTATSSSISSQSNAASPASTSASAPPPLALKPSYSPPTDPGAMAPRLEGDDKDMCFCGKPAEDDLPFCSLACECQEKYEEEQQWQEWQEYQEAKMKEAHKTHAVEDSCVVCGKEAEDGLPYCSLACECQAKYEEDEEWQQALEAKAKAQEAQKTHGH